MTHLTVHSRHLSLGGVSGYRDLSAASTDSGYIGSSIASTDSGYIGSSIASTDSGYIGSSIASTDSGYIGSSTAAPSANSTSHLAEHYQKMTMQPHDVGKLNWTIYKGPTKGC